MPKSVNLNILGSHTQVSEPGPSWPSCCDKAQAGETPHLAEILFQESLDLDLVLISVVLLSRGLSSGYFKKLLSEFQTVQTLIRLVMMSTLI